MIDGWTTSATRRPPCSTTSRRPATRCCGSSRGSASATCACRGRPTGTNLLGIVRHVANVEIGYFGPTFGREWPTPTTRSS